MEMLKKNQLALATCSPPVPYVLLFTQPASIHSAFQVTVATVVSVLKLSIAVREQQEPRSPHGNGQCHLFRFFSWYDGAPPHNTVQSHTHHTHNFHEMRR
uniref:Uncharacterized protein n=1 Tax=Trypanosoma congolense (strain IL3000) TaxID=1068625 RepID=G0UQQ8_TRYCI|nr:hypothetical protein, unlikely [Trypanosoma congolense IL3000]